MERRQNKSTNNVSLYFPSASLNYKPCLAHIGALAMGVTFASGRTTPPPPGTMVASDAMASASD